MVEADTSAAMLDLNLWRFVSLIMSQFYSTSCTHNAVTKDMHPQTWHLMVTLSLPCKLLLSCIQHISYTGAMLCVKWQDPDGGHLVRTDGLPRWFWAGYAQANTYARTHIHRWQPAECGQEMSTLTIDLLRSMISNLVIWQRGSCTHRAGTEAWHIDTLLWLRSKISLGPVKWIWAAFKPFLIILF